MSKSPAGDPRLARVRSSRSQAPSYVTMLGMVMTPLGLLRAATIYFEAATYSARVVMGFGSFMVAAGYAFFASAIYRSNHRWTTWSKTFFLASLLTAISGLIIALNLN